MKNITLVSASIFLLIGTILFAASNSAPAYAASTGVICIIPAGAFSCPSSPASIAGTVGTQLRVSVFVQNSTGLNGFDVTLLADHTILKPAGADFTGTVLPGPQTLLLECLSGVLVSGPTCSSTDTIDTLHLAVGSAPGTITGTPTTGLLFTAIYNVTRTTSGTTLGFQTGCGSPTAPTSDPPVCVTVANGSPRAVPEAVESAIFSTVTTPNFVLSANPSSLTIAAGSSATFALSITSINSFAGIVSLTTAVSPPSLPVTLSTSSVTLTANQTLTSTLTASTSTSTPTGTYTITITGTSGSLVNLVSITLTVNSPPQPGFTMSASPDTLSLTVGSAGNTTISLGSTNGFAGTVNLTASISKPGLSVSFNPANLTLPSGGTRISTMTVSTTSSTAAGPYSVLAIGRSLTGVFNTVTVSVMVTSQPDFALTASPSNLAITAGSSGFSTITLSSLGGFTGTINLAASISPSGPAISLSVSSIALSAGGSGTSTLTVSTTTSTASGSYTVIVSGVSGTVSHSTTLSVMVNPVSKPDFSIGPSGVNIGLAQGASTFQPVTLTSLGGFTGTVSLTDSVSSSGLTLGLSQTSVTLTSGGTASSTLTISTTSSTPPGSYTITITGTSGSISHAITVSVTVFSNQPDFTIAANPSFLTVPAGTPATSIINTGAVNGFNSNVILTLATSQGLTGSISPTSIGPNGQATLTVTAPVIGNYTATVTGTSGSLSHSTIVFVKVTSNAPDFTITANPTSLTIVPGASGLSSISLHGVNGFNNTVFLSVSASSMLTATINPTSTGPFGTATLTVTSNTAGSYTAQVTGTSGSISHTTTVTVIVSSSGVGVVCIVSSGATPCPFSPASITGTPGTQLRVSVFIQGSGALNGFDITLLADHTILRPAGIDLTGTVLPGPTTIIAECLGGVIVHGNVCSGSADTLELAAVGAPSQVTFPPTTGLLFTAIYNVTGTTSDTPIGYQTGCTSSSVSGTTTCVVIANGSTSPVPETVQTAIFSTNTTPDFVMTASPGAITITAGSSGLSTVSVTSSNGFSGTVSLNTTVVTGNLTISINPVTVTIGAGQTATSTITISAFASTPPGTYSVSIAGLSGSLFHSVAISLTVNPSPIPDFSLTVSPSSLSVVQGTSATSTATLTSLNGFTGTVTLSVSVPAGLTVSLAPGIITLSSGGTGTSVLTVSTSSSTPLGIYTVILTGLGGSISHSSSITVTVTSSSAGDFTISENPTFQAIPVGSERQTIITVTSVNGFSGNVNLVITPSSAAFACWFTTLTNTATVFVPAGSFANQFPTCGAGRPAGVYNATISGTSGSLSHNVILGVTVTDYSMSASSVSFAAGSSGTSTVTITSLFGLSGPISLSVSTPPALTGTCPSSVTLSSGGTSTASCTFSSATLGTYGATITGTFICSDCYYNGKDAQSTNITVTVTGTGVPDFSISATPSSLTIAPGASGTSTITVTSLNGFSGVVSFTVTPSPGIGAILSPTSVTGSGTATLTVGTNSTGTFTVQVTGTSGSLAHSTTVTVTVSSAGTPDFSLTASPSSITIAPNTSGTSTITATALNGFSGIVSLTVTAPSGISATITPASITGPGTATLTVTGSSSGAFSVMITGVSGSIAHSITIPVTVTGAGVVCIVQSGATSCPLSSASLTGAVGTQLRVSVFIQGSGGLNGFDVISVADHSILRPVGVDLTGTVLLGTPTIVDECLQGVLVTGSVCSSVDTVDTLHLVATSALGSGITATPTTGLLFTAIYNVTGTTSGIALGFQTGCSNTSVSGGVCVTVANGSTMPVPETVQVATFSNSAPLSDFSISAGPASLTIPPGSCGTSTVRLASLNGFSGTITLITSVSPAGPTATLSSTSVTLSSGASSTAALTVCTRASTPSGSYKIAVAGTGGSLAHMTTVGVTVSAAPNFTITAAPTSQTIRRSSSAIYTIIITGTNGFNGTVHLATTTSPIVRNGPTISLPSTVGPYSNSTLTVSTLHSTPVGTYTITVTATSGSITHAVTITVVVTR
ncbi:hypothetical protein AUI06_01900 [archaeon 13_2_20CM_2_52_21]|nr:MAG: hypothetical protein AUI06_01900 [archaeon 13_2_20CM_2_52_21]